jgi:uncharacterized membrane protein
VDHPTEREIFTARIVPHRSLSRRNFRLLVMLFSAASFFTGLPFVILGAWPIAGFMGADVALFYFAFRANYRAARAYEDVSVTPLELVLAKVSARGLRQEWRFNPSWTRLERRDHEDAASKSLPSWARMRRRRSPAISGGLYPRHAAARSFPDLKIKGPPRRGGPSIRSIPIRSEHVQAAQVRL